MTELGVRPCVAYLKTPPPSENNRNPDAGRDILPKLDAREVAAVFTASFRNFLYEKDLDLSEEEAKGFGNHGDNGEGGSHAWYKGSWHSWHETAWRMHQFFVPVRKGEVFLASKKPTSYTAARPPTDIKQTKKEEPPKDKKSTLQPPLPPSFYKSGATAPLLTEKGGERYRVFGMTARILVDAARVAYGQEPEYEHNSHFGDEDMIAKLMAIGRLSAVKKEGEVLTREVMKEANRAKI